MGNHHIVRRSLKSSDMAIPPSVEETGLSRGDWAIELDSDPLPCHHVLKVRRRERRRNYLRRYVYRGVDELRRQQNGADETPASPQIIDRMI
jgi:hypothetical protein